jgi:hypothetical protein
MKDLRKTPDDTASASTFTWILKQLSHCKARHEACAKQSGGLPARVLDLGHPPWNTSTERKDLRLSTTRDLGTEENLEYACLSHCWGSSVVPAGGPPRTTLACYEDHKRLIVFASLPKTFQEAIICTRRIGIRFLWVDSLCIIQDDEDDWTIEFPRMDAIYGGSIVTIASTHSMNSHGGLFSRIGIDSWIYSCRIMFSDPPSTIDIHVRTSFRFGVHRDIFLGHHDVSPLLSRGWVHQERVLAPRTLYYTQEEVVWECRQKLQCQCASPVAVKKSNRKSKNYPEPKIASYKSLATTNKRSTDQSLLWIEIVESYSKLALTVPTDKFPALAGLAKYLRAQVKTSECGFYVAGLWSLWLTDAPFQLLWYTSGQFVPKSRPSKWRAPSWSWASIDAGVEFRGRDSTKYLVPSCKLSHVECFPRANDVLGELNSGHLHLRGYLVPLSVFSPPPPYGYHGMNHKTGWFGLPNEFTSISFDLHPVAPDRVFPPPVASHDMRDERVRKRWEHLQAVAPDSGYIFGLLVVEDAGGKVRGTDTGCGLVLRHLGEDTFSRDPYTCFKDVSDGGLNYKTMVESNSFERIGYFESGASEPFGPFYGMFGWAKQLDLQVNVRII